MRRHSYSKWNTAWYHCAPHLYLALCLLFSNSFIIMPVRITSSVPFSSQHHKQLIFAMHPPTNFSSVQTCFISLFHTPEEADSCSASQLDICIAGLFFIRSTFPSQKRRTLKSFKSHYGWRSVQAKTDFFWFCSRGEEMREAKSLWRKIQTDMAGHEEGALKCTAPIPSFHHVCLPCLAAVRKAQCDRRS